jgi:glycosyltransferase involved in cell wall biosynthesis
MVEKSHSMPRIVSIIVPTKASGGTFHCAMSSLLSQTYQNFEVIVVDDNSNPEIIDYLGPYREDPRIKIVKSGRPQAKGNHIGELLNLGVSVSVGNILARLDADDFWMPNHLESQLQLLEENNLDLVGSQSIDINFQGKYISTSTLPTCKNQIVSYAKLENPFIHSSVLFTRKSFTELGGYSESMSSGQDYDLWLRYLLAEKKVANNNKITVFCIKSAGSVSSKTSSHQKIKDLAGLEAIKMQLSSPIKLPEQLINIRRTYGRRRELSFFELVRIICISPRLNAKIVFNQIQGIILFLTHKKIFRFCLKKRYDY